MSGIGHGLTPQKKKRKLIFSSKESVTEHIYGSMLKAIKD